MATKEIKDQRTGAIIKVTPGGALTPPDPKTITRIDTIAGKNPKGINLRDHPALSGMEIIITDAKFGSGDIDGNSTAFVAMTCFIYQPGSKPTADNATVLVTGSDNVYGRVAEAFAANAFPIQGTLRKSGRAWFLD